MTSKLALLAAALVAVAGLAGCGAKEEVSDKSPTADKPGPAPTGRPPGKLQPVQGGGMNPSAGAASPN